VPDPQADKGVDNMSFLQNVADTTQGGTNNPASDSAAGRGRRTRSEPPTPPGQHDAGTGGSLTRVTANFTPRAMASLEKIAADTGDSKTDILNRSVMVYEVFLELLERSGGTLDVTYPDGAKERWRLLG
jgi:hypothetical protein